jgi:hypothetical protein
MATVRSLRDRIDFSLGTLKAIEAAVNADRVNANQMTQAAFQARVDNVVRLYCADQVEEAMGRIDVTVTRE